MTTDEAYARAYAHAYAHAYAKTYARAYAKTYAQSYAKAYAQSYAEAFALAMAVAESEPDPEPQPKPPDFSALLAVLRDHGPLTRRELAVLHGIPFKDSRRAVAEGAVTAVPKPGGASVIVPVEEASRCRCRSARGCRDARRRHGRH